MDSVKEMRVTLLMSISQEHEISGLRTNSGRDFRPRCHWHLVNQPPVSKDHRLAVHFQEYRTFAVPCEHVGNLANGPSNLSAPLAGGLFPINGYLEFFLFRAFKQELHRLFLPGRFRTCS